MGTACRTRTQARKMSWEPGDRAARRQGGESSHSHAGQLLAGASPPALGQDSTRASPPSKRPLPRASPHTASAAGLSGPAPLALPPQLVRGRAPRRAPKRHRQEPPHAALEQAVRGRGVGARPGVAPWPLGPILGSAFPSSSVETERAQSRGCAATRSRCPGGKRCRDPRAPFASHAPPCQDLTPRTELLGQGKSTLL